MKIGVLVEGEILVKGVWEKEGMKVFGVNFVKKFDTSSIFGQRKTVSNINTSNVSVFENNNDSFTRQSDNILNQSQIDVSNCSFLQNPESNTNPFGGNTDSRIRTKEAGKTSGSPGNACDTDSVAKSMIKIIDLKDSYTGEHSQAVQKYTGIFAKKLNLSNKDANTVSLGAAFHDIGKIGIPESILNSRAELSDEDLEKVRQHPVIGDELIKGIPTFNGDVSDIVRHHHESWDGKGYPDGLSGTNISFGARMVAIVDSYHAMTSDRPYREAMSKEQAVEELKKGAGKQWDPNLVQKFIEITDFLG